MQPFRSNQYLQRDRSQRGLRYDSGDADSTGKTQIQCNPLIIDGIIYGTNPALKLFALDGTTGKELWKFHPPISDDSGQGANRGLTVYGAGDQMCIIYTSGAFIYAVNAKTGKLVETFGDGGKVDLHKGLDRNVDSLFIVSNSPGVIYKDLFIVGSRVSESIGHVLVTFALMMLELVSKMDFSHYTSSRRRRL
ncbi:MAG: PQQ-binding-like beta-propeller repeat protein [Saprospiraceae bacterium]|nr:PQQ-binding-like beta-propeller repeat protein [Saprospiraceae bacterium]